jgi:Na+-transporting methylmalonyl-CoA/oxaloacetate decarboxylase gamma subunit
MRTTQPTLGKYLVGMVTSLIILLAGGWLILAPFALGYQHYGADWTSQTTNDFVTGIAVAVVALASFLLFLFALLGALRASGMLAARTRGQQPQVASAPVAYPSPTGVPAAASNSSDLDRTLSTLAAALAADLTARRQTSNNQQSEQPIEPMVNRREM